MPDFAISDKKGFPNLKAAIRPEIKVPGRMALGILVDADDELAADGRPWPSSFGRPTSTRRPARQRPGSSLPAGREWESG